MVGHSFGGAVALEFATRFTDEVVGVGLVDASPLGWPTTLCEVADDGTDAATAILAMCAGWSDPTANTEWLDVLGAFAELDTVATEGVLTSTPLAVVTAEQRELPDGIAALERDRLTRAWDAGQLRWASLSSASLVLTVARTGHHIELDQPSLVVEAVTGLLP